MNVLIFADERKWEADLTVSNVFSVIPEANVYTAGENSSEGIQTWIDNLPQPYFLSLHAGTSLLPEFRREMELALYSLLLQPSMGSIVFSALASAAGAAAIGVDYLFAPVLWKRGCIGEGMTRGFADRAFLPFPKLRVTDKHFQGAACGWSESIVASAGWMPPKRLTARPGKQDAERELIVPILSAAAGEPVLTREPDISILLCAYNEENYIPWAIRSVLAQTYSDWELIIVDDASTDSTTALLAEFTTDSRIRCIRNETNQGKAKSLNRGLQAARGCWIVELDADDWLAPECLKEMITIAWGDAGKTALWYSDYYEWVEMKNGKLRFKGLRCAPSTIDWHRLLERAVPLAPRFYRKETLLKLGGWSTEDPSLGRLYEDFEIIVRLLHTSPISYVPQALYHRRLRPSSITRRHTHSYGDWKKWLEKSRVQE
ncbi:glycosyltransferase family 2 protein [Paenibacillus wynnii]|uniref:glycosyltransferase family 2 protein n=1 Tax=Paenibacillus wynnii TaxID=268407 RepID=UPI0027912E72|nr:glycosyltransferase family 2 protein [Paenibacillus wynnii]MDQ0192417.1 GT2 family glycosyltransferase [Paenibacillus wynnii]